mgnify:CR=1 FL=1|jgi:Na+-transporting methylmalonyl-CoA/oxaloacetate decarboxylase gamma subunit
MTLEDTLIVTFSIVIILLVFLVYLMYVRMQQILRDFEAMEERLSMTDSEVENLIRNVEEIKKLKI